MENINFNIKLVKRAELENPMSKEQFDANYQTIMDTFKQLQPVAGFIKSDEEGYSLNTDTLNTVVSELPAVKNTGLNNSIINGINVSKDTENNTVSLTHNITGSVWMFNIVSVLSQVGITDLSNGVYVYAEFKAKTMLPKSTSIAIVDGYIGFTIKTSTESELGYEMDIKNAGVISANAVNATLSSSSINTDNDLVVVLSDVNNFDDVVEGYINNRATHSIFNSILTQDTIPAEKSDSGSGSASSSGSSDGSGSGSSSSEG
jgi:hypothetical protein